LRQGKSQLEKRQKPKAQLEISIKAEGYNLVSNRLLMEKRKSSTIYIPHEVAINVEDR
jgi:hypothetical protein